MDLESDKRGGAGKDAPDVPGMELADVNPISNSQFTLRKDFIFLLGLVILVFIAYNSPLREYIGKAPEVCARIKQTGMLAPVVFVLGVAFLVSLGVPRLLLCPIGGMAFGFFQGLLYCVTGTVLGYYVIFLFIRWGGREFVLRHWPRLEKLTKFLEHGGVPSVIVFRQMPIHGMAINLILGLSPVRHRDFLLGTFIGMFPQAIPFTLIGKGAKQGSVWHSMVYMILAVLALAGIWLAARLYSKRSKSRTDAPAREGNR